MGDLVRISFLKSVFQREYHESTALFVTNERFMQEISPHYKLNNCNGQIAIGTFYENKQIKGYEQEEYLIEKVIRRKRRQYLVKWKGWNDIYNTAVNEGDLRDINEGNITTSTS